MAVYFSSPMMLRAGGGFFVCCSFVVYGRALVWLPLVEGAGTAPRNKASPRYVWNGGINSALHCNELFGITF